MSTSTRGKSGPSSSVLVDRLQGIAEQIREQAIRETRRDLAEALTDDVILNRVAADSSNLEDRIAYLLDDEDFELTPDFVRGMKFIIGLVRDETYDL